jgi:hypothetical protein
MNYRHITCPITKKIFSIHTNKGVEILKKYINISQTGGDITTRSKKKKIRKKALKIHIENLKKIPIGLFFPKEFNSDCINGYIAGHGWHDIVSAYKAGKEISFGNEELQNKCNITVDKVPGILFILGAIREYTIKQLFIDTKKQLINNVNHSRNFTEYSLEDINSCEMKVSGSSNLTSDYDITVMGPIPSIFIWHIYSSFIQKFNSVLPLSFDSNLYPGTSTFNNVKGLFNDIHIKPEIKLINLGNRDNFIIHINYQRRNINVIHNLLWAFCKLSKSIESTAYSGIIKKLIEQGALINTKCNKIFCNNYIPPQIKSLLSKKLLADEKAVNITKNYYYQCKLGEPLDLLYRKGSKFNVNELKIRNIISITTLAPYINSISGYSSLISWLSSEAYFSAFSVYAIVVSLQMGYHAEDFPAYVWIIAAIENLADLLMHMKHELHKLIDTSEKTIKQTYIKYSKYMYRIVYCLNKLPIDQDTDRDSLHIDWQVKLDGLAEVIKLRKTLDLDMADTIGAWVILEISTPFTKEGLNEWLSSIEKKYMVIFEKLLNNMFPELDSDLNQALTSTNKTVDFI